MALLWQLDPDSALSPWSPIRFRLPTAVNLYSKLRLSNPDLEIKQVPGGVQLA